MKTNVTNQTANDVAQMVKIIAQRQHELNEMGGACPCEFGALEAVIAAAHETLGNVRVQA